MNVTFDVKGLKQLDDALNDLALSAQKSVLRKAGREAMGGVAFAMAMGANVDPNSAGPHMRDDIKTNAKIGDTKKGDADNAIVVRTGPSKAHAQKAIAQEYGTEKQTAQPFMRPALYENRERVVDVFKTQLAISINKAIQKARRAAK